MILDTYLLKQWPNHTKVSLQIFSIADDRFKVNINSKFHNLQKVAFEQVIRTDINIELLWGMTFMIQGFQRNYRKRRIFAENQYCLL